MTFTYAVFAVPFICAGLYFYGIGNSRQRILYVVMFGIATAINYFAAFAMLALIVADNAVTSDSADSPGLSWISVRLLLRRLLMIIAGLIPVNIVYVVEHYVSAGQSVCFWLPDFQYWNLLFEKHCLDGFYWFWLAYILFIAVCPLISGFPGMTRLKTAAVCGTAVYGIMIFSSSITPDFVLMLLPFTVLMVKNRSFAADASGASADIADTVLMIIMIAGPVIMCLYSSDYNFGVLSIAVTKFLNIFGKLGIGSIIGAATLISMIYSIYRTLKTDAATIKENIL
ncbi:MAG: hypothetical protein PUD90_00020 [Clostridia bacterium]|nr:hypothetical protein [[Bacteroides] pectinophilus]MDD5871839.1 hypothetical protein [Clostridia bacterium]